MGFFTEYKEASALLKTKQPIIFYVESRHYYSYFEQLITDLLANGETGICYITSDQEDPLLQQAPAGIKPIYVKWMLGFLFSRLKADVMIMTMPDLDNLLFKRSKEVGHYIYMFHAAVSTHQQYRKKAFVNYDCIFCTGSYQVEEIKNAEMLYHKRAKTLIPYGYPLLDTIQTRMIQQEKKVVTPVILVAPSWFEGCIFDTCLPQLLLQLAQLPYQVIVRSHPEYEKRKKKEFEKLRRLIAAYPHMQIDKEPDVIKRLVTSDILITDRSGIAFEFAFGVGKPVLFIDTILKQTNPDWKELEVTPIENKLRSEMGVSILPAEMEKIPATIKRLETMAGEFAEKIATLKKKIFFNSPEGYQQGCNYVLGKIKKD